MGQSGNSLRVENTLKHARILTDYAVMPSACAKETQPRSHGSKQRRQPKSNASSDLQSGRRTEATTPGSL